MIRASLSGDASQALQDPGSNAATSGGNRNLGQKPAGASNPSRSAIPVSGSITLAG